MNFILAWILLTIGFSFGMKPLLLPADVLPAIEKGQIILTEGLRMGEIEKGSWASKQGFLKGDVLTLVDGKAVDENTIAAITKEPVGVYGILRDGKSSQYVVAKKDVPADFLKTGFGITFSESVPFPRPKVFEINVASPYYLAGVRTGDSLITVNGSQIYSTNDFEEAIRGKSKLEVVVFRDGNRKSFAVSLKQSERTIIDKVLPDMAGAKAGLKSGDIIKSVNGTKFGTVEELIAYTKTFKNRTLTYVTDRKGEEISYGITTNSNGQIGLLLSALMSYEGDPGITLYNAEVMSSLVEVKDEKYPVYVAAYKSLGEMVRLSKLTATMFVGVVGGIFSTFSVPDTVAGPVGIAIMTNVLVKEGLVAILRFIALLSLSLAVINILPIPALDGGRLLFLVVEFIIGRRVSQRLESFIHGMGYALILLLILMVTYSDIVKLFS